MTADRLTEAFTRTSRFHALGLVLDLEHADADAILATIHSADALKSVRLARSTRMRFVVLAGQLLRRKAGAFAALAADPELLPGAAVAAHGRLTAIGETASLWVVLTAPEVRNRIQAALATITVTDGSA